MAGIQPQVGERYLETSELAKKMISTTENSPRGFSEANSPEIYKGAACQILALSQQSNKHTSMCDSDN